MNDEQPDHDDGSPTGTLVVWPVVRETGNDGSLNMSKGIRDVQCFGHDLR
jgi:hypothetical protein